jgi:hypothetical protein
MREDLDPASLAADVVAAARRLSPQIVATQEEAERLRHLPPALARYLGRRRPLPAVSAPRHRRP